MVGVVGTTLRLEGLTKRFGGTLAVDGLTATVHPGRVTGFLGPNGAGKTTTLRMLLGLVRPTAGSATFDGKRYDQLAAPSREVGTLLESTGFIPAATPGKGIRWLRTFLKDLAEQGRTVLVSSHVLPEVEQTADDVLVLAHGRLVRSGSLAELQSDGGGGTTVRTPDGERLVEALTAADCPEAGSDRRSCWSRRRPRPSASSRPSTASSCTGWPRPPVGSRTSSCR